MTRGGRKKDRAAETARKCIATGDILPTAELIRFVTGPDGTVVPDLAGKLPGRGMWVKAERAALSRAVTKNLFPRAAKAPVKTPDDLVAQVEDQLQARVVSLLALARKAGQAICGFEKVRGSLDTGMAVVLLQAADGSERGKSKLRAPDGPASYIGWLSARELGLAFGRDSVIHGALTAGGLTMRVVEEATRLAGVRENDDGGSAAGKDTTDV
ncbi:RNA-binding protein [Dinoroseobacter sp. S124A]|uniref:RNA-binding protein n=1 Tax=Dinoroseobacter sp. S124A TaxID=3415128 RepID=UPI003C79DE30